MARTASRSAASRPALATRSSRCFAASACLLRGRRQFRFGEVLRQLAAVEQGQQVLNFDDDGIRRMANEVVQAQAGTLQAVYDRVLQAGQGKSVDEVKVLLQREVRLTLGGDITDPELTSCAEVLAQGRRIEVRPELI